MEWAATGRLAQAQLRAQQNEELWIAEVCRIGHVSGQPRGLRVNNNSTNGTLTRGRASPAGIDAAHQPV